MIKFIACDMDGTLVDDKKEIDKSVFSTIEYLNEKNVLFCAASGRQYNSLKTIFGEYGKNMVFISENGSYVVYDNKQIYASFMDKELWQDIVLKCTEHGDMGIILCCKDYIYTTDPETVDMLSNPKFGYNVRLVDSLIDIDDDILKVSILDDNPYSGRVKKFLETNFKDKTDIAVSGFNCIDNMKKGVSKGKAVREILENMGIAKDEAAVFGDNFNDLEMFDEVYYSFAMKNAVDEIKERANFVTSHTNNECGVVKEIEKFIEKGVI